MKHLLFFLCLCMSTFVTHSQTGYIAEIFQSALMETKTGAMLVYTGEHHSFTLNILGKIKPSDKPNLIFVENKTLQSSILPFQTKLDFENLTKENQQKYLLDFMEYEMNYIKKQLQSKSVASKYEFIILDNKLFLLWYFDMPKSKSVHKQCYLSTICFDQMLLLNSQSDSSKSLEEIKEFIISIGKTLKLNNHSIDLDKLYNTLNNN